MNKYEKDILRLWETHAKINKSDLITNINNAVRSKGIYRNGKNRWISKVTGYPLGTVYRWFTHAKCREFNKIPLNAVCSIAIALEMSVWDLVMPEGKVPKLGNSQIDRRRSSMYCYIKRREAEDIWDSQYAQEKGLWNEQDKAVKREFLDRLYLERLELYERGYQNEENMEEKGNG